MADVSVIEPPPTAEEAAALAAAIERFLAETGRPAWPAATAPDRWREAALLEGVSRAPGLRAREPWLAPTG